jgi:hypothetical protein
MGIAQDLSLLNDFQVVNKLQIEALRVLKNSIELRHKKSLKFLAAMICSPTLLTVFGEFFQMMSCQTSGLGEGRQAHQQIKVIIYI